MKIGGKNPQRCHNMENFLFLHLSALVLAKEEKKSWQSLDLHFVSHFNWILEIFFSLFPFTLRDNNTISSNRGKKFQLIQSRRWTLSRNRHPRKVSEMKASLRAKLTTTNRDRPQININWCTLRRESVAEKEIYFRSIVIVTYEFYLWLNYPSVR